MPAQLSSARSPEPLQRLRSGLLIAALAWASFHGFLGSIDVWGKREQRAAAEAIDTFDHQHWLVARIQGRARLEKPPLPRWSIAGVMLLSGRRDEWALRLPGALAGMATVALVYALGRRMAGSTVGLASAMLLSSMGFFVGEMRQASNDGPLALFTTLALYAFWRLVHDEPSTRVPFRSAEGITLAERTPAVRVAVRSAKGSAFAERKAPPRIWCLVFYTALGLGFLTKGPVIVLLVALPVMPYLITAGRPGFGLRRLVNGWGLLLFAMLALSWPLAVLAREPGALRVWTIEMTEKTGFSQLVEHRRHALLLRHWPLLVLPWPMIAVTAAILPFFLSIQRRLRDQPTMRREAQTGQEPSMAPLWFAWWWAIGSLLMFCFWAVAKPNYYLPCLPGLALLAGSAWVWLTTSARGHGMPANAARLVLRSQWILLLVAAALTPVVVRHFLVPSAWPSVALMALPMVAGVACSVHAWRRGGNLSSLAPLAVASVVCILIAYGWVAPAENARRSHRALAESVSRLVPPETRQLNFFSDIDEGLWFYLRGIELTPVPGGLPQHYPAYHLAEDDRVRFRTKDGLREYEARSQLRDQQVLRSWLDQHDPSTRFLLIRKSLYERYVGELSGRVLPLFQEAGVKRNELVLLEALDDGRVVSREMSATEARR
jgi:4-amino-4-deoxy-L-arabinose transferase-like glycosyltransferase